jgi:uncharacterized protein YdhG (YjbR/CyaY superfamily)
MKTRSTTPKTIDDYIAGFPADVQAILQMVRQTISKAAHEAEETISYQIPTFKLHGKYLIYFAGYQKHIGLYPVPRGSEKFKRELAAYGGGKGTLRLPLDQPIPYGLITRIVKFRIRDNQERAKRRRSN